MKGDVYLFEAILNGRQRELNTFLNAVSVCCCFLYRLSRVFRENLIWPEGFRFVLMGFWWDLREYRSVPRCFEGVLGILVSFNGVPVVLRACQNVPRDFERVAGFLVGFEGVPKGFLWGVRFR